MISAPQARSNAEPTQGLRIDQRWERPLEFLGLAGLAGLTLFFLAVSWRRWPDPLIDYGQQLYVAWRISNGAVLYRDLEFSYGPLSQYWNAGLFACFGPGLMVLVEANLAFFAAILATLYGLFRRAWGKLAALVSAAIFVAVFGFSQYVGIGNYNYATPYSHESTHGLLVCLLLAGVLVRWTEKPSLRWSGLAGLLLGIAAVLKPEILLSGTLITLAAVAVHLWQGRTLRLPPAAAWAAGAVFPTAGFTWYFSAYLPWKTALLRSSWAWMSVVSTKRFTETVLQKGFMGLDRPWLNFVREAEATLLALLLLAAIAAAVWLAGRGRMELGLLPAGLVLWLAWYRVHWLEVGRCLLGLALIYLVVCTVRVIRRLPETRLGTHIPRLLLTVLAVSLMARMFLNGRIYQFGFYQAALAGMLAPAVLIGELPERFRLGGWGRVLALAATLALIGPAVARLAGQSIRVLELKTLEVGQDADRFYGFPPEIDATAEVVRWSAEQLALHDNGGTLLVLPEGEMINYLTRLPGPTRAFVFYGGDMRDGGEEAALNELRRQPPEWALLISRDLREYGIGRYGEQPGEGRPILQWVLENYQQFQSIGGDPLDYRQIGGVLFRRKPDSPRVP